MKSRLGRWILPGCVLFWFIGSAPAADWPTYRHDNRRSGISPEAIDVPMSEHWVFTPLHPPCHAWPDPQPEPVENRLELPRLRFDDAFHVAAGGGKVFFGSSSENAVYALDARTGEVVWRFHTDGPVRLAPTLWRDRLYVGCDDGKVYCLGVQDGDVIWRFSAAPKPERVLGNGKMISRWPVRTGVLVEDGVAYFGGGVFPGEGPVLYAVDAEDGTPRWRNDTYGRRGLGTISPQGYMLASAENLYVSSGRVVPAAFDRRDGSLRFHRNTRFGWIGTVGGTYCVLAGDLLFNGAEQILGFSARDGRVALTEGVGLAGPSKGRRLIVDKDVLYLLNGNTATAVDRNAWVAAKKELLPLAERTQILRGRRHHLTLRVRTDKSAAGELEAVRKEYAAALVERKALEDRIAGATKWRVPCECVDSVALTPNVLFAGAGGRVVALDVRTGKTVWSAEVSGKARGIAVADGRLLVSTDRGSIHCFVPGPRGRGLKVTPTVTPDPFPADARTGQFAETAETLVRESGITRGYGLILGGTGRVALELARRTDLMIYLVEPDEKKVAAARKALSAAGLYGPRVVVEQASLSSPPYSDYFANLILCEAAPDLGGRAVPAREVLRMLKPCGGVAFVRRFSPRGGAEPRASVSAEWRNQLRRHLERLGESGTKIEKVGRWTKITRGPLAGAGSWTHQYAEPGNTACGDDRLVRGPIGVLWYGEPGPGQMPSRHASNAAPLAIGGRMFIQGDKALMAYDSYNGLLLWRRRIPGAMRLHMKTECSNKVADADSVFVAVGDECLRLDAATGRTLRTYRVPPAKPALAVQAQWPIEWQVLGPLPKDSAPLPAQVLKTIPRRWQGGGKAYTVRRLRTVRGILDFSNLYGGYGLRPLAPGQQPERYPRTGARRDETSVGRVAYAFARIDCPTAGRLHIGAGADWWMTWYIDGREIYNTLATGNVKAPVDATNHTFSADVAAGEHVLAVMVKAGSASWTLASAGAKSFQPPPVGWVYLARAGDLLYGSRGTKSLFALNIASGRTRWVHEAGTIMPMTICVGDGRVFFVDRDVTEAERREALKAVSHETRIDKRGRPVPPDVRRVVALDAATGGKLWSRPQYVSDCVRVDPGGGELTAMYRDGVLLLCGQPWNGHFWKQFEAGEFDRRSLIALSAEDGRTLWSAHKGYRSRPLIVGDRVIAEPWACDLKTGADILRPHPVTHRKGKWQIARPGHHCGNISASPNYLFFRSGTTAYYDLIADQGTVHFGAQRPGCWINCVPANGLVLMPEASSGCICPYSLHCTIVFQPKKDRQAWGMFSTPGAMTPVEHLAINLGAPGDRRAGDGALWLGYPRAGGKLVLRFGVSLKAPKPGGPFGHNPDFLTIAGTDKPWLYASGFENVQRLRIRLVGDGQEPRNYTVRLHFADTEHTEPGRRVFDVSLTGQATLEALKDFDIIRAAGGPNRAVVKEFKNIRVASYLHVDFKASKGRGLLCAIEALHTSGEKHLTREDGSP